MKFHSNDRATPRESKSQSMGDRGVGGEGGERAKAFEKRERDRKTYRCVISM